MAASSVLVALVLAVGTAGIAAAARVPDRYAVQQWLPREPRPEVVGVRGQAPTATLSSAVGSVAQAVASLPNVALAQLLLDSLQSAHVDPLTALVERDYTTVTNPDGTVTSSLAVYTLTDSGLSLAFVWTSPDSVVAYLPPAVSLPARPDAGTHETSAGLTNAKAAYSVTLDVRDNAGDCAVVDRSLTQQVPAQAGQESASQDRWCRGLGNVSSLDVGSGTEFVVTQPSSSGPWPTPPAGVIAPEAPVPLPGMSSPISAHLGGLAVGVDPASQNLVTWTVTNGSPTLSWQHHPGGDIVAVVAGSGRIIVTTTLRDTMAFDVAGQLRWITRVPELPVGPLALGTSLLVTLADGRIVTLDPATGTVEGTVRG